MTRGKFYEFLNKLRKDFLLIGPKKERGDLFFSKLNTAKEFALTDEFPFYPPKKYLVPQAEVLFEFQGHKLKEVLPVVKNQILLGINLTDLKAVMLYDQVFEKDPYYQKRQQETVITGQTVLPVEKGTANIFGEKLEEDVLEHLKFDILFGKHKDKIKFFTGSEQGQNILDKYKVKDYQHVNFQGPIPEQGVAAKAIADYKKVKNSAAANVWEELGKKCIACGKCTTVCPTCFCFQILDKPCTQPNTGLRCREWDSCFYNNFSRIADDQKFLKSVNERIYFWYQHKFVRIPEDYQFTVPGCIGCGRCIKVCPVGIDIKKVLDSLKRYEK
ncbi:MAG: 4Fe-4S dicluster domain-containing protein [Patescibacteria group bacterium]